ncbi:hypothetical protein, partial [Megasphaera stantonii]|uniref:hypothetical protein n=1 Tax=Megasphaera stantonii TaxID=2144175 RepID=UPI001E2B82D3
MDTSHWNSPYKKRPLPKGKGHIHIACMANICPFLASLDYIKGTVINMVMNNPASLDRQSILSYYC